MMLILMITQINDTILKSPYRGIEVQSFDARGVGALSDDCIKELAVDNSRPDGYVYLVAYDNEGNSGDILRFPYRGISVQGFTNPENSDQPLDCIYAFNTKQRGDTAILEVIYDGDSRNTPDTAEIFRVIYRGVLLNSAGFPSSTGGYYAIRAFVAGVNSGLAFLRVDTTYNVTPVDNEESPPSGADVGRDFSVKVHLGWGGTVRFMVYVPSSGALDLSVYDVRGRLVFSRKEEVGRSGAVSFSTHLPSGLYILRTGWRNEERRARFIVY